MGKRKFKSRKTAFGFGGKKRKRIRIIKDDEKRSWFDLPYQVLELIKKRLFYIDQVNFRLVCKSWSCVKRVAPLQQIPWLLVLDNINDEHSIDKRKGKAIVDSCTLVDSKTKTAYNIDANVIKDKLKIRNFKGMKVHESKYGWLLISSSHSSKHVSRLCLYSPFFSEGNNFIRLPVLNCDIDLATFTSNPLDKEDCMFLTLHKNDSDNTVHINTYRRRGQRSWNNLVFKCECLQVKVVRWMYSAGIFYYVTLNGVVGKFDFVREEWNVFPSLPIPTTMPHSEISRHYRMVKSDGELFLILHYNLHDHDDWWSKAHHIYRLDLSSMIWEDLSSIGELTLFIGDGYNSVLNASVMKFKGERREIFDKIYYSVDDQLKYCSVHDYTRRQLIGRLPKLHCSRYYGRIAKQKYLIMLFIDPPSC